VRFSAARFGVPLVFFPARTSGRCFVIAGSAATIPFSNSFRGFNIYSYLGDWESLGIALEVIG